MCGCMFVCMSVYLCLYADVKSAFAAMRQWNPKGPLVTGFIFHFPDQIIIIIIIIITINNNSSYSLSLRSMSRSDVDLATSMSLRHFDLSKARRFAVTRPKLSGRRSC